MQGGVFNTLLSQSKCHLKVIKACNRRINCSLLETKEAYDFVED